MNININIHGDVNAPIYNYPEEVEVDFDEPDEAFFDEFESDDNEDNDEDIEHGDFTCDTPLVIDFAIEGLPSFIPPVFMEVLCGAFCEVLMEFISHIEEGSNECYA